MRRSFIVIMLLAVFGFFTARFLAQRSSHSKVTLIPAVRGTIVEAVYATGRVDSDQRAAVRARVSAPLLAVLVGAGEGVRRGQVLAIQDDREVTLDLAKRENERAAAVAAATEAQDAALRLEKLHTAGLVAELDLIRARERARELQEKAEALQKALELARERKTWATLRAPIDGTVTNLVRRAGDLLQVGDEVLTVVNLKEAYLRAAVDERDLGKVTPGQEARIVFEAFRDNIFVGRVWRVVPHLDRLTRSADVLIRLPEGIPALSLDLTATVNIVIRTVEGATLVPKQALRGTGEERTVLRPGPDARLEAVPIRVGACDVEQCQVVAGLQPGDLIVANPANVKPGERVKLQ